MKYMFKTFLPILMILLQTSVLAAGIWDIFLTTDKSLDEQLKFFDKISTCTVYKYHAEPSGIYEIYGKRNGACALKWTLADCNFPDGIYQEFAKVQKQRIYDKFLWQKSGILIDLKDKNYRYLYDTGNKYCRVNY